MSIVTVPQGDQAPLGAPCKHGAASFFDTPLLTEVRQVKLGCSEGESPSRLMEESVFGTKEKNGKV